jgi:putative ABC transport system permease protein
MENLLQDLRYAARQLRRSPSFAFLTVLTIALGIGVNTATFSIVDAVLLRPLPYKDSNRLVVVWAAQIGHIGSSEVFDSYREFEAWQSSSHSFEQLEALTWATAGQTLSWRGQSQRVLAIPATQGIFALLGVPAARGRTFVAGDLKAGCTVVLSYRFWQDRLGASSDAVGGTLTLDGKACAIIGVMPKEFEFYPRQSDLWTLITPDSEYARQPLISIVGVFGRLKPGVTRASAQAELTAIHRHTLEEVPAESWIAQFVPVVYELQSEFTYLAGRNLRMGLLVLFAAVTLVLLIACVNVANLTLGRAGERNKELAIRSALGAGRSRLVRQLLAESLLLSGLGAALGAVLAAAGVAYFRSASPVELPPGNAVAVNLHVLVFTALLAVLTGLGFGLVPACKASRPDIDEALKQAGRGGTRSAPGHRSGRLLVVFEAALSLVLLVGAGLLIESIARLGSVSLGFDPGGLLTAGINLPKSSYPDANRQVGFYGKLVSSLGVLPGVRGAALTSSPPPAGPSNAVLSVEGRPAPRTEVGDVAFNTVSSGFFRVMSIPLQRGRTFDSRDREESQPVAIVNEALVHEYFPHEDPMGREIRVGTSLEEQQKAPWLTIVGVVGSVKQTIVYQEMSYITPAVVYRPLEQAGGEATGIVIRTSGKPLSLRPSVGRAVADLDKDVPVSDFRTADDRIDEFLSQPRFRTVVMGVFAGLALLLAAIGIYGVLSQSVTQRTHEIGIRMALGAQQNHVLRPVVWQGMILALGGVGAGLVAALALTRLLTSMLYGVTPGDPLTLAATSLMLIVVAILASYIPARRATKVDPMVALRHE